MSELKLQPLSDFDKGCSGGFMPPPVLKRFDGGAASRNNGKEGSDCREFEICTAEWEIENRRLSKAREFALSGFRG